MIKIKTPVIGYNGIDCGVRFENGIGVAEDLSEHVINWFKDQGYTVEETDEPKAKEPETTPETDNIDNGEAGDDVPEDNNAGIPEVPETGDEKSKAELLEEAKALGIENIRSKATKAEIEKLIADKKEELEALGNADPETSNPEAGEENGDSNETPEANPEAGEQGNEDSKGGE